MLNLRLFYDIHIIIFVQITFVDISNEIISPAILSLPLIQARQ